MSKGRCQATQLYAFHSKSRAKLFNCQAYGNRRVRYNARMQITDVTACRWTLPLRAPFTIAKRTAYEALNVAITVRTTSAQICGYGASAPVAYITGESVESVIEDLDRLKQSLVGCDITRLRPLLDPLQDTLRPAARAGLEIALYDAWAKAHGISLWQHFGASSSFVHTDLTIPIVELAKASILAQSAWDGGIRTFKIKVGSCDGPEDDLERIRVVARTLPHCRLRIDANQAFLPSAAIAFVKELEAFADRIDLIEQPVDRSDIEGLSWVRKNTNMPIFADEAVCTPQDAIRLIRADAVDGLNLKLMKCGVQGTLDIAAICHSTGTKLMLGCMLETSIGITAAAVLAGGIGRFDHIDLDSHSLLTPVPGLQDGFIDRGEELLLDQTAQGWGFKVPRNPFDNPPQIVKEITPLGNN